MAKLSIPVRKAIAKSKLTEAQLLAALEGKPAADGKALADKDEAKRRYSRRDMEAGQ